MPVTSNRASASGVLLAVLALTTGGALHAVEFDEIRLPEPSRPALVALLEAGRPAEALDALDAEFAEQAPDAWPTEALVLRATLLSAAGRPAEAANAWTAVGALEPGLADFAGRSTVECLVAATQPDLAEARLNGLSSGDPARTHPDLLLLVASAHGDTGQLSKAAALYRRVLASQGPRRAAADAASLGLASALEAAGDVDGALEALHDAQLQHSASETFISARAAARRLASAHGLTLPPFDEGEYRSLADRLSDASRFAESVELLEECLTRYPDSSNAEAIEAAIASALYSGRQNAAAMARAHAFIRRYPDSGRLGDMRLVQFRLDVREGRTDQVRTRGYELWRGRVAHTTAGQRRSAALLLAAYLVSVGEVKAGLAVYRELYAASTTASQQRDILWRAGVAALRDGQLERAALNLRALMARRPDAQLREVGTYWLGVAEARLGNPGVAARAFRELIEQSPYSYYGVRAADRYAELAGGDAEEGIRRLLEPAQTFPDLTLAEAARSDARFRAASVLARAGRADAAARLARELAAARPRDQAVGLLAARASAAAGDHQRALTLVDRHFRRYLDRPTSGHPSDLLALAYPRAYWDDVRTFAEREGVDPLLLLAIMRQESRYEAPVRSVAGAVGLFQMMPYTAEALATELGIPAPDEDDLKHPTVSAALGARLVGKLLTMFDGQVAPVAASYNAGEERAIVWWRSARELDEPMFVDSIPYSETRTYVRRVLANYFTYTRLAALDPDGFPQGDIR